MLEFELSRSPRCWGGGKVLAESTAAPNNDQSLEVPVGEVTLKPLLSPTMEPRGEAEDAKSFRGMGLGEGWFARGA